MASRKKETVEEIKESPINTGEVGIEESLDGDYSSIFIDENNTFEITIETYPHEKDYLIKDLDPDFDTTKKCKEFKVTFKYPSYADKETIVSQLGTRDISNLNATDIIKLEETRVFTLIRSWTFPHPLSQISKMNPKFIRAMCEKVRSVLLMDGII